MTVNAVAPGARRCCSVQPPEGVTMHSHPQWRAGALGLSLLWAGALAQSQGLPDAAADSYEALRAKVEALRVQLRQQQQLLDALTRQLGPAAAERGAIAPPRSAVAPEWLAEQRGMGGQQGGAGTPPAPATQAGLVGQAPDSDRRPPAVAPLFEQPGVLTPRGKMVLEPSFQFGYSSSDRVALVGYTIIPALLIGLVDVREEKHNTSTATLTGRYGISNRTEVEVKLPYVYRSDADVSREIFTGSATDAVFDTSGKGMGDVEVSLRHQLNDGGVDQSYYIGGLRFKARNGKDPFQVVTDCMVRCVGPDATGTCLPLQLPTGSGFYGLQPSLTWLYPSTRRCCSAASAICTTSPATTSRVWCSTARWSRWAPSRRATCWVLISAWDWRSTTRRRSASATTTVRSTACSKTTSRCPVRCAPSWVPC